MNLNPAMKCPGLLSKHWKILTLTAGALGLSLTFIHQIVPGFDRSTVAWLFSGWGLLIASLLSTLISFQTSQAGLRRQREILDLVHTSGAEDGSKYQNRFGKITLCLNIVSLILFIVGVVCLTFFITTNTGKA